MHVTSAATLILAGAGHSHLVTLRAWLKAGYRPPADTLLISPEPRSWYSGMMPGLAAGRFTVRQCAIELAPWCRTLGIQLVVDTVDGVNVNQQTVSLQSGRSLQYGVLSLNTGALNPGPAINDGSVEVVPAKPFAGFERAWEGWRRAAPTQLGVLGGGPAAFELALALRRGLPGTRMTVFSGSELLEGYPSLLARQARALLVDRGIALLEGRHADSVRAGQLFAGTEALAALDALVLASGAFAPSWLADSGLACDGKGFVRVGPTLRSLSHPTLFASGDCAALPGAERSGVYAVRQGAVLAHNLRAALEGRPLHLYEPQPRALALLSTADGGALLRYGPLVLSGRLPGLLKDYFDLRFMRQHRVGDNLFPYETKE